MIKTKFSAILGVLVLLAVIFIGCQDDGGGTKTPPPATTVSVTGVTLKVEDSTSGASIIYYNSTQAHLPASITFTVIVEPSNATNKAVTWTVTPDTYVTWDEAARTATAKALSGENLTTVTVKTADGDFTESWTIKVADPTNYVAVETVIITSTGPFEFTKPVGGVFNPAAIQLEYEITPPNATNQGVSWESSDEDVVTVDHTGLVTPVGNGTADITLISDDDIDIINQITVRVNDESVVDVPVTGITINGAEKLGDIKYLYLPISGTAHLTAPVNTDASNHVVIWSSDRETGAGAVTVVNGTLTAGTTASANGNNPTYTTITATADGNTAIKDTVKVVVLPAAGDTHTTGENWKHTWSFREAITGWTVYDSNSPANNSTVMTTNATLAGGLVLKAGTTTSYNTDGGTSPLNIRWQPFYGASSGSSSGNIQTNNATLPVTLVGSGSSGDTTFNVNDANKGYFLEIPNVGVPFKITMYYSNTGGNPKRYPIVYANGVHAGTLAPTNSTTAVNDNTSFYGSGETSTTVQLACSGGLRIFDVIIEKIDPLPEGLSVSPSVAKDWIWSDADGVPAANKSLTFNVKNNGDAVASSVVTWSAKSTNNAAGADVTGVDITNGVLTASSAFVKTADVWVFAAKDTQVSEGYKVTVKKIAAIYNFSDTWFQNAMKDAPISWPGTSASFNFPNTSSNVVGDLTIIFSGNSAQGNYSDETNSLDNLVMTKRVQLNGASAFVTNRVVKFPIGGGTRYNITIYGRFGSSATANRTMILHSGSAQLVSKESPMGGGNTAPAKCELEYAGSLTELYVGATGGSWSLNGIMVEILEPAP